MCSSWSIVRSFACQKSSLRVCRSASIFSFGVICSIGFSPARAAGGSQSPSRQIAPGYPGSSAAGRAEQEPGLASPAEQKQQSGVDPWEPLSRARGPVAQLHWMLPRRGKPFSRPGGRSARSARRPSDWRHRAVLSLPPPPPRMVLLSQEEPRARGSARATTDTLRCGPDRVSRL
jgi:hypothetical protein